MTRALAILLDLLKLAIGLLVGIMLGVIAYIIYVNLCSPAHAAGNAPGPAVQEGPFVEWVQVVDTFGPVDLMHLRRPPCSLDHPCTGPSLWEPPMAPVPVPWPGLLLALGLAGLWRMKNE